MAARKAMAFEVPHFFVFVDGAEISILKPKPMKIIRMNWRRG